MNVETYGNSSNNSNFERSSIFIHCLRSTTDTPMKQVIYNKEDQKVPVKLWLDNLEEGALQQALNLSRLPFAFSHIAIMPDSHQGYGMPIGGVLATTDAVIPNAVGVDIGCGMTVVELDVMANDLTYEQKVAIAKNLREAIPVGRNQHDTPVRNGVELFRSHEVANFTKNTIASQYLNKAKLQLGTLGGGNHFVEIQESQNSGRLTIMIHSGSRHVGYQIAKYYTQLAQEVNEAYYSDVPSDLAFLPEGTYGFDAYMKEYKWALQYAKLNRSTMMDLAIEAVGKGMGFHATELIRLNKPHNFVDKEHHFGRNVWVHRKGATRARKDEFGMIPSSMGDFSYIVKGKGNDMSFKSCSHGAGRTMSRTKAKDTLDIEIENQKMKEIGNMTDIRHGSQLDEAPSSYKDMDTVMENQKDLIEIEDKLKPLITIKG